jgi:vacuolar-type H+-ATPase subunit E/Vma4
MQEIVHQMIELEQKAAALVKEAEAEASRITESAGLECEKLIHEERQKASEAARSLSTEARKQAEAARREQVARAMQALDRELNAAEAKHEAGVAAVLDAVLKNQ